MSYADGRYWITYNGEIYNFLELRDELESCGHEFISDSDTEVILAAYTRWGEACQLRLNGMWAFAIWDRQERLLFLSRDRFGVKPLYYLHDHARFVFASEMKAFLALDWFPALFDPNILARALEAPKSIEGTEDSLLQGVKRLRGGYSLKLKLEQAPRITQWWSTMEHLVNVPPNLKDQVERFRELFFDACRIRMRSDVPLGTSLSGGLDSSSVICSMAQIRAGSATGERLATDWQRAFVAQYPGTTQDETSYAEEAVRVSGAIPIYKEINPDSVVEHFDECLYSQEEVEDLHIGPWMVYRELRRAGIVVSMDGHGGDETLAGYQRYPELALLEALGGWPQPFRLLQLRATLKGMSPDLSVGRRIGQRLLRDRDGISKTRQLIGSIYRAFRNRGAPRASNGDNWLRPEPQAVNWMDYEADPAAFSRFDSVGKQLYQDFHFTALPTILRNFDRCSMAHGVEIRAPFLDWRLVCFAFSLPTPSKIGGGYTKRILREAMRGVLPEVIRTRTDKIGFRNPVVDWIRDARVKTFVLDSVNSEGFLRSEIWNGPKLRDLAERSYQSGEYGEVGRLWKFIQASRLMELFRPDPLLWLLS